ncbi:hypothetical protein CQW23_13995 [Capsicum baccatum]|uniref:Ubiquitin-like protease family profile domain-containing protein n=1 Tax=Capsicum baccatum TaxID=33114 RepID=A0A2G2WHV6_CAPBA|nr:hypothetical protein CQW23_13995 [Capsicum baccatum]
MKYRIDKVPEHPLHILSSCNRDFAKDIKFYFEEDVLGTFRNTLFEIFLNLPQCNWIGQISKCILMLEIQQDIKDGIHCSFNNVQPTSEEVRTLDLSFSEDFVVFDPTSAASTSVAATLKRSGDEDQSRVVTADDDYDDFTTRPTQEFLRKAQEIGVSPEHEQLKSVPSSSTTPEGTPKSNLDMEQIKSYVKTYVDKKIAELKTLISNIPAEVVKALKKEENKESSYEDEDKGPIIEISNDELSILVPLETEIQDCVHIHTECPTITEAELIPDKEQAGLKDLGKKHDPVMDEHNVVTEAGCNEELNIQHSPDMKQSEDENIAAKKATCSEELNKHHGIDVKDLQDDVDDIITESVQDVVETLLFGLSTPSDTKKFDVVTPNIVMESQWSLSDSHIPPDFPDAQVRKIEAAKTREIKTLPVKRDRKKLKVFRSPYITKFGSSSKSKGSSANEEKQMYAFDGCTIYEELPNQLISDYSQWLEIGLLKYHASKKQTVNHYLKNAPGLGYPLLDFVVTQALSKNWFYLIPQHNTCWNDKHLDVIFYHLRKKLKLQQSNTYSYTTTNCFFKIYIEKTYERYFSAIETDQISTQEDYTESVIVASDEIAIPNIINGFCIPANLPWHLVDEVYVPVNCGKEYHWVLTVIVLKERVIRVYDSLSSKRKSEPPTEIRKLAAMLPIYLSDSNFFEKTVRIDWSTLKAYEGKIGMQTGEISHNSFDVEYVQNIPQQASDSL